MNLSPPRQKEQTFEVLVEQIAGLARHNPVLMIFEDVHWVDPTTLDMLGMVVDRIRNLAALLVITYRPEFEPPWGGYSHVTLYSLNRPSRQQGAQMVSDVTGGKTLSDEVRDQIIAQTDGVPLFVEELTKAVMEAHLTEDRKRQGAADATVAIPATLQDSLMVRLDRLDEGKPIAQQASAIGREFSLELLVAMTSAD